MQKNTLTPEEVWSAIYAEALGLCEDEPVLVGFYHNSILNHATFSDAVSFYFANLVASHSISVKVLRNIFDQILMQDIFILKSLCQDIQAHCNRDPACNQYSMPFLYFKGFQALQLYRFSHWLLRQGNETLALYIQNQTSEIFGVDIHPAAKIGSGIMIDHATGVVIGETAVIEDNVSMLHGVTLGGCGTVSGRRHPTIRHGVLISAGAKILGNIDIGACAKIGACSVVLHSVGEHQTAVGVPAKTVGRSKSAEPALEMDHNI